MITICDDTMCYGCGLCQNVCPSNAITIDDTNGFYRPRIHEELCVKCHLCITKCPGNKKTNLRPLNHQTECYAAYTLHEDIHYYSASGGLCTELSMQFVKLGGC